MDALTKSILDTLIDKGADLAKDLVLEGVALVRARLSGEPSDAAIIAWIRETQGRA